MPHFITSIMSIHVFYSSPAIHTGDLNFSAKYFAKRQEKKVTVTNFLKYFFASFIINKKIYVLR